MTHAMHPSVYSGAPDLTPLLELSFKSLLDSLPCYVSLLDANFRFLYANKMIENDFGSTAGETCFRTFKGFSDPCRTCLVSETLKDKEIHIGEGSLKLAKGKMNQVIVCTAPLLNIMGGVMAVIKIDINISKIKEAHRELIFLGESMALLSHDIKNILEGLQGGTYVVEEGIKDNNMSLAGKGWRIVKKNIFEISRVTQNILYSSRKREPEMKAVRPGLIVNDVISLFQEKASSMGVNLTPEVNPNMPAVRMDPVSMVRMLGNLVWNGIEACGSEKEKSASSVHIRSDYFDKTHYMLEVEDNGKGMEDKTKNALFSEYFSTKGSAGTGLGLIVVDRIAKQHKGRIDVLSKLNVGSLFRVILPLQ